MAFYEKKLGLEFVADEEFAIVFRTDEIMVRIQKVEHMKPPEYTIFGFEVKNIKEMAQTLQARGVTFLYYDHMDQDEFGIWTAEDGSKVAWFTDPDENTLSLTEFP